MSKMYEWIACLPPSVYIKNESRGFTQQIHYLKHYYKHNPYEICGCCQELVLACFLQMNSFL